MKTIYNHSYSIPFKAGVKYSYGRKNILIDTSGYQPVIYRQLPDVIQKLKEDKTSRRAVIIVNHDTEEPNACLLSIQYGIDVVDNILYCTATFRSQCEIFGRPGDTEMILNVTDDVQRLLGRFPKENIKITCNVFNYHRREDIVEQLKNKENEN